MTDLRQLMRESVEHEGANLVRLAARARTQGTTLRRRRRVKTMSASVVVVAAIAAGSAAVGELLPARPGDRDRTSVAGPGQAGVGHGAGEPTDATTPVGQQQGQEPPIDPMGQVVAGPGRGGERPFPRAGRALRAAVSEVIRGATITDVQGVRIPGDEHNPETVGAYLDLAPSAGAPAGGVSVFHLTSGWWGSITAQEYVELCPDEVDDCQVTTLPDGTVVKSYSQVAVDTPTGPWIQYRVERLVDGVVIGLNAYAARAEDEEGSVLAANPPLTMEQLVDVAAHLQPLR